MTHTIVRPTVLSIPIKNCGKTLFHWLAWLVLCGAVALLTGCRQSVEEEHRSFSRLEQIKASGVLTVLTRHDPSTYYEGPDGPTGLEYDLVNLFAKQLGVTVKFVFPASFDNLLAQITEGKADIAAAGLTNTPQRAQIMRFAPTYQSITEQLIYRVGNSPPPKDIDDLKEGILEVVRSTTHASTLTRLLEKHPHLQWNENSELDSNGLLFLVNEGLIDYTIADSQQVAMMRRLYPNLGVAFDISRPQQLAWALPLEADDSLYREVASFFEKIKRDKTLHQLIEKHYSGASKLTYFDNCIFRQHVKTRLPNYLPLFKSAAQAHDLDWRLLAAMGYQESHWRDDNTSPTGVQGVMMLTHKTASELGFKNRNDPKQSVMGGALYFKQRLADIDTRITEPDRTWFALAAYNVGLGHLEDARQLTRQRRGDPNKWLDVKKSLPLLSEPEWHGQTKHGYARGYEPVQYVENIRSYYNLLVLLTEDNPIKKHVMTSEPPVTQAAEPEPAEAVAVEPDSESGLFASLDALIR